MYNQFRSKDPKDRLQALKLLRYNLEQVKYDFSTLPDKQQAWNDVVKLTNDSDSYVSIEAAFFLGTLIAKDAEIANNQEVASSLSLKIHILCLSKDPKERFQALKLLRHTLEQVKYNFSFFPDKKQVWSDVIKLINDSESSISQESASLLGILTAKDSKSSLDPTDALSLSLKIHILCLSEDPKERFQALKLLRYSRLSLLPDKQQMWNDLIRLANDQDNYISIDTSSVLRFAFDQVPDKQQAWNDLLILTNNNYDYVKYEAASALGSAFCQMNNKQKAWDDLHKLTDEQNVDIRRGVASSLGLAFSQVPNKQQAWDDLHGFTEDQDISVKRRAANSLGLVFSQIPDKQQAWEDLHRLIESQDLDVKKMAVNSIGFAFPDIPDKEQAYKDLIEMANISNEGPDKEQAYKDLIEMANISNEDIEVYVSKDIKACANHSLGRVSIFKASKAEKEEDFKYELEKAIEFFEKAAQEAPYEWLNLSSFCLPFYRSFHSIIFKTLDSKKEVDKYLAEARSAIESSKNRELLFEAVNKLANASNELQNFEVMSLESKKSELHCLKQHCDDAEFILKLTEKTSPYATEILRKGFPLLNMKLRPLIEEIKEKATIACKDSQSTPVKEITSTVNRDIQKWEIGSQEEMSWYVENLVFTLESSIPKASKNQLIFDKIKQIREEKDLVKQYGIISVIIPLIPKIYMEQKVEQKLCNISKKVEDLTMSLSESKTDITISAGIDYYGNGVKFNKTIPLSIFQRLKKKKLKENVQKQK